MTQTQRYDLSIYRAIGVEPVNGALGAEISGVEVREIGNPDVVRELRRALAEFSVLFLRDQDLNVSELADFAELFGVLGTSPLAGTPPAREARVGQLVREANVPGDVRNNGDRWHMDRAQEEKPPKGFVLYCEEAPAYGGDTLFASLTRAFAALPPQMQKRCAALTGVHSMIGVLDVDGTAGPDRQSIDETPRKAEWISAEMREYVRKEGKHPLVCRHPDTGQPYLFVSGAYMRRIKELPLEEGRELVDRLNRHVVRPEFTCRFRWRKGSLAVLDNRVTQHYAVNDYAGFARRMRRVELEGDYRPVRTGAP